MTRHPRVLAACAITVALLATAACGSSGEDPSTPTTAPLPTVVLGDNPNTNEPTTPPAPTTTPAAPTYPSDAKAYAQAILAAWKTKNNSRLGDLTTAGVHEQIIEIPGPINQGWHYHRCEGAAGSSYCVFFNDVGDMIRLQVSNPTLGQAHAGVGVTFEQVTFPADPTAYVRQFIGAWQQGNTYRMKILASADEVSYFTHYTPPDPGYSTCTDAAAGTTYVRVYNSDGLDYVIKVSNAVAAGGDPHAITGHVDPPNPPACP